MINDLQLSFGKTVKPPFDQRLVCVSFEHDPSTVGIPWMAVRGYVFPRFLNLKVFVRCVYSCVRRC